MEYRYVGRNVDLSLLSEWIIRFLKRKGFIVVKEDMEKGSRIVAKPTHIHEIIDLVRVSILGDSKDFLVKFTVGARSRFFVKFGLLTEWLGGGFAFLRGSKSQDEEDELERKFWIFIHEKIDLLADSAE
ncbi:MAG: hypothetical protein NWF11_03440 [Candidatus Bathyarchaeota archaeon]|nr:hypothetical protein [Candidatus Bathyarchaeota archaeon]